MVICAEEMDDAQSKTNKSGHEHVLDSSVSEGKVGCGENSSDSVVSMMNTIVETGSSELGFVKKYSCPDTPPSPLDKEKFSKICHFVSRFESMQL